MADLLKEQDDRKKLIFGDGMLKKATLEYMSTKSGSMVAVPVQFNPSEYSISRKVSYKKQSGLMQEPHPDDLQSRGSELANLKVKLTLDIFHG